VLHKLIKEVFVYYCVLPFQWFYNFKNGWWSRVEDPGECMGLAPPTLLNFKFCLNRLSNKIRIESSTKVDRLMKKMFHSFLMCTCFPPHWKRFLHHWLWCVQLLINMCWSCDWSRKGRLWVFRCYWNWLYFFKSAVRFSTSKRDVSLNLVHIEMLKKL